MSEQDSSPETPPTDPEVDENTTDTHVPKKVAIEGDLPLTAIDIESQKDMESGRYHPLRSLDKWFAARPTPAVRLSIIASAYPGDIESDKLLKLMQIGPKELDKGVSEYVERKYERKDMDKESGETLDEYYGYPNPNTRSPTASELQSLHDTVRDGWGGELPTIIDPTAGRGIIPFEATRYKFPVISNEYNPIPVLINKVALEYAPEVGSIASDIDTWTEKIIDETREQISEYYPTKEPERQILNSAVTYMITCDSCSGAIPLIGKWWLNKTSNGGDAVRPRYEDGEVSYEHVKVQDDGDFDPSDAPVSRGGDAECPHCSVPMDSETIRRKIVDHEFEYSIYGVNYESYDGSRKYRAGSNTDQKAMQAAAERVESDFEMLDFFSEKYPGGSTDRVENYGVKQWRDLFTPKQLVAHYELFNVFDKYKEEILEKYETNKAELILILLSMGIDRQVQYNNRLAPWRDSRGYGSEIFNDNNYSTPKRMFVDNNICAPRRGLSRHFEHVIESYEKLVSMVDSGGTTISIHNHDAADLKNYIDEGIDIAVVDPPYFDSIMYGELSDFFYMTKKQLVGDVFPELFESELTEKKGQAVANPDRQDNPEKYYEEKMKDIFNEMHSLLNDDGVLTLMFTDREIRAWNTISKALIQSGFTITASHPIKTEMTDGIGAKKGQKVESSILLIARKRDGENENNILWNKIEESIEKNAREEARRLLSLDHINKIDVSIAAFGPALERFSELYPVEDKYGEEVEPKKVLAKARQEVTNVIANDELNTETDPIDGLTRWYILCYTIYSEADIPFDEANQLGMGADVEITELKTPTKIWSKSSGDVSLNDHTDRVQDIVKLRDDRADNPSSRKYPVNPTETTFTYAIDAVHAALHVYEREGPQFTRDWLAERGFKNDTAFTTTVKALLEAVPSDTEMHDTLTDLISGETGDYLDISVSGLNITNNSETQTGLEEFE
jgi:adenine-specific DNA methylase